MDGSQQFRESKIIEEVSEDTRPPKAISQQLSIYYANCALIATTHRDISLYFGRIAPMNDHKGVQRLVELYENQIYMTLEQAEDLLAGLAQTVQSFKTRFRQSDAAAEKTQKQS